MNDEMERNEAENYETNLLSLVDEDGVEHDFELADSAEFEGCEYVALIPVPESAEEMLQDSGELVIFKVLEEDGEEVLEAIEDDDEFDKVGAFFMERLADTFEFEEE